MKKTGGLIALVLLLAGSAWLLASWSRDGEDQGSFVEDGALANRGEGADEVDLAASDEDQAEPGVSTSEREVVAESEPILGAVSRIIGRIEDTQGLPIADTAISINSVGEPWAEGIEQNSYSTTSDGQGRFELLTPLPTSTWISLRVSPSRFHTKTGRNFGIAGGRNKDPLVEGDNDLGLFTLQDTGAIAGIVRLSDGGSPRGAYVRLDGSSPGGYSLSSLADTSGRYVIEHVPAGHYGIKASLTGYLISKLPGVDVRVLAVSDGCDLTLEQAPLVSGRVLDEDGAPIQGVKVHGWPLVSGQGAGARTDDEGEFTVYLPQDEPFSFTAKLTGYATFGEEQGKRGRVFEPGTTNIEIELVRETETTFIVVDASSGAPVERFGISVGDKPGASHSSITRKEIPLIAHPDGVFIAPADPKKHGIRIQASGYAPQHIPVEHESETSARQVIGLLQEGRLHGRVVFAGEPVPHPSVRVLRCLLLKPGRKRKAEPDIFDNSMTHDMGEYVGRLRMLTGDATGGFALGGLAKGTYRIEVSASVGSPRIMEDVHIKAGETLELADVVLAEGASVQGRILLDGGMPSSSIVVHLDSLWNGEESTVNAADEFAFRGVAPGKHELLVDRSDGLLHESATFPFEVSAGESLQLDLDLGPWQTGSLRVRILDAGKPLANARVSVCYEDGGWRVTREQSNANGELLIKCRRSGITALAALSEQGLILGRSSTPIAPIPGTESLVVIELSSGQLSVNFPPDFVMPLDADAVFSLAPQEGSKLRLMPARYTTESEWQWRNMLPWEGTSVALGSVAVGEHKVSVFVQIYEKTSEGMRAPRDQYRFTATVQVIAGEATICTLKSAPLTDR